MLNARERIMVEVLDMKCLRNPVLVEVQRIRNKDIRERCGDKASLLERADQNTEVVWLLRESG